MRKDRGDLFRKLVAVLLALGGLVGIIIALMSETAMLSSSGRAFNTALVGFFAFLFGFSGWTGVDLWRNKTHAFQWAQVLLVAQIPIISFPGLAYHFYTGMVLYLQYDQTSSTIFSFQAQLGSAIGFRISSSIEGFVFGINLIAVIALYLLGKAHPQNENVQAMPAASI